MDLRILTGSSLDPLPSRKHEFAAALQTAGIKATLVNATLLTHEEVNSLIGAAGDTVMTGPLMGFLSECFK